MYSSQSPEARHIVFVVDDETAPREMLHNDLSAMPEVAEVYAYASYAEATLPLLDIQPDVLFLDVEMPGTDGITFLETIRPRISFSFHVVFYTAHSYYMLDAIRHGAFDFLLKPYLPSELQMVMERIAHRPSSGLSLSAEGVPFPSPRKRKIALQTFNELIFVQEEEILMAQYVRTPRSWLLTLTDGSVHRLSSGLTAGALLRISPSLVQINAACIINITYLSGIENTTRRIRFCAPFDKYELTASTRYFSQIRDRFNLT